MAQVAWNHGWKTADLAKDNTIIYFDAVINAFKARFKQLGGKIKFETTYQDPTVHPGSVNYHAAATALIAHPAKVIVTATAGAYGALGPMMDDLRTCERSHAGAQLLGRRRDVLGRRIRTPRTLVRDVRERVRT